MIQLRIYKEGQYQYIESRFYVVENPVAMKEIRKKFAYFPWGDSASALVVNKMIRMRRRYREAQDKVWEHGKDCPNKLQELIKYYEGWLENNGYICMEDMPADMAKVIDDNFKDLG